MKERRTNMTQREREAFRLTLIRVIREKPGMTIQALCSAVGRSDNFVQPFLDELLGDEKIEYRVRPSGVRKGYFIKEQHAKQ